MGLSQSKLLSNLLLCVLILAGPSRSLGQTSPVSKFPSGGVILSPVPRLPTDSDRVIRDFVHLLHPDWDNSAWDLVITGKRSMNPNFGVDSWSFAVLDAKEYTLNGFPASAIPCSDPVSCFGSTDVAGARFVGRIYQRGSRVYDFVGVRPEIAKKNADFQKDVNGPYPGAVEARLIASGAHYPPSKEQDIRRNLEAKLIFAQYGFRLASLHFCYETDGPGDKKLAMFWSAQVLSAKFRSRYLLTVEPFEGDITGLHAMSNAIEHQSACMQ